MPVTVTVNGVDEYVAFLADMPDLIMQGISDAVPDVSGLVLEDQGGGAAFYPAETEHNQPPEPYYVRGQGEQFKGSNDNSSEQMDMQFGWYASGWDIHIQNTASYAEKVIGETQDPLFAGIGWQTLYGHVANLLDFGDEIVNLYIQYIQARIDARGGGP